MARDRVQVIGQIAAPIAVVWDVVRDFCGVWHPWIATMRAERGPGGAPIRAFTVQGDDTLYREQRVYLSDSDHTLAYLALQGIQGAERYVGRITLTPSDLGTTVSWSAEITAPAPRAAQIAQGTGPIFEAGIVGLAKAVATARPGVPEDLPAGDNRAEMLVLPGTPRLALSVTPAKPGPLVLFLHGIGGARGNWAAQLAAVAPHARAAALDLRGYGDSTLGFAQSSVDDYCDDILRVMQALDAERLVLVGLSYGAWIATSFAMRHPDKLAGLVLSGGCTGMSEAGPVERDAFRVSREVPLNAGQTPADFAPAVVKVLAGPNASDATKADLLASMSAIPTQTYRDALVCFTNPLERFDFARLTMPVLLMTGQHDRLAPPPEIRGVAGRITDAAQRPDVQFEEIAGAGHLCNLEQPAAYDRALVAFVQRVGP